VAVVQVPRVLQLAVRAPAPLGAVDAFAAGILKRRADLEARLTHRKRVEARAMMSWVNSGGPFKETRVGHNNQRSCPHHKKHARDAEGNVGFVHFLVGGV